MRISLLFILALVCLPMWAMAQDPGTKRLKTLVSGTVNYGAIMPGEDFPAHFTFADTEGAHQGRAFMVIADQINFLLNTDIATTDTDATVEIREVVNADTFVGSVAVLNLTSAAPSGNVVGSGKRYYIFVDTAPGGGVTADLAVSGSGSTSGFDPTIAQTISGLMTFSAVGTTSFAGDLSTTGLTIAASAAPNFIFDHTGSTGTDDGGIEMFECLAAEACSWDMYVNSGSSARTTMIRIKTTAGGATTIRMGDAVAVGAAMTNYISIDENGLMQAVGTASIVADDTDCGDAEVLLGDGSCVAN